MSGLSESQVASYREHGYILVERVFSTAEVDELKRVSDELVAASATVRASNEIYDVGPGHQLESPQVRRIKHPQLQDPVYAKAARNPRLLDILADLIGPAIRFDHGKLNFKPVGGNAAIEWHQDWAFYPHTNDDLLAVGILLEDCGPEDGPLMVVPGSHRGPVHDHHHDGLFIGALDPREIAGEVATAEALTGPAGSCTFHHVRAIHGSTENRGKGTRPLLLFSYAAVDAWPLVRDTDLDEFNSRILSGEATLAPRQEAVPVRLPLPKAPEDDSIFDNQAAVQGRSFGAVAAG